LSVYADNAALPAQAGDRRLAEGIAFG